jgi:citrate synthase
MTKQRYLTAKEATDQLGINTATLYAYVSRGLIRSEAIEGDSRIRRYHAEDVQKLKERKEHRKNPAEAAKSALHWGTPILESALTLITDGGLYYRGYDALMLATTYAVEQVAALLWLDSADRAAELFDQATVPLIANVLDHLNTLGSANSALSFMQKLQIALALASADDLAAYQVDAEHVAQTGSRILQLMTAVHTNTIPQANMAESLAAAWCPDHHDAARLLNSALILCADHELNVSSFTARVVASAGVQPYMVVTGGLAALQGYRHGGMIAQVESLLRETGEPHDAQRTISERLRRGERIPGFGHPLYPDGDPRGTLLLQLMAESYPDAPALHLANALIDRMRQSLDLLPNIDFTLAVLARVLTLPDGGALAIFALGRTIGWIGHALEQYAGGDMIRPRASYNGVPPRPM